MKRIFCLLIVSLLSSACTSPGYVKNITAEDRRWLLSGEALPTAELTDFTVPEESVLYLTREMQHFAEAAVSGYKGRDKVKALIESLLFPSGLDLQYDAKASFTAEETFRYGRANCLSFTHIFVAMARHVGMDVQYNEVDVPPIWDIRQRNTLVLNKHVNAMVIRSGSIRHVVDLNVEEFELHYEQRNISDQLAVAQHYNNKAMGHLVSGEYVNALQYMVKALGLAPEVSYLWNNLGSLYRRSGNLKAAELSYLIALTEDSGDLVAISNVARLYEETGNDELATYYRKKAHYFRMRNPYFLYNLAQQAFANRDYARAEEIAKKAIHRYDKEHRFYFLLGAVYQQMGNSRFAHINFSKALELSDSHEQQAKYRNKMDRISQVSS